MWVAEPGGTQAPPAPRVLQFTCGAARAGWNGGPQPPSGLPFSRPSPVALERAPLFANGVPMGMTITEKILAAASAVKGAIATPEEVVDARAAP